MKAEDQKQSVKFILSHLRGPVVMVGMMGAGKTQIGKALAKTFGWICVDSDAEIEKAAGSSISDIFEFYGEPAFRDVEHRVIKRLLNEKNTVIATGGGAVVNAQNRQMMRENSLMIWLDANIDTLYDRVSGHSHRPLLQTDNPKQKLADLLDSRRDFYAQAHLRVPSENVTIKQTRDKLLVMLEAYLAQNKDMAQD